MTMESMTGESGTGPNQNDCFCSIIEAMIEPLFWNIVVCYCITIVCLLKLFDACICVFSMFLIFDQQFTSRSNFGKEIIGNRGAMNPATRPGQLQSSALYGH